MSIEQQATPADPRVAGVENLLADYQALEAEAGTAPEAPEAKPDKAPEKVAEKPKEEPKKPEGKKTAAQYAADRIAAKNARIAEKEAELTAKEQELVRKLAEAGTTSPAALKAMAESGKADELAKAIGFESWEKLNDHFARLYSSPEYKRIRELEEKDRARDKADADARASRDAEQLRAREAQQWADAQAEVGETLKGSDDAVFAKFGEDDGFCAEVLRRVVESRGALDINDAARDVIFGVEDEDGKLVTPGIMHRTRAWTEILGDRLTVKAETAQAGTPTRPGSKQVAKPQKHVSRQSATEAANPLPKEMTDAEWKQYATDELSRAWREQQEKERRERTG